MTLSHIIEGPEHAPRAAFVLHGILGSARNWRSFSRRLRTAYPGWAFILVDLRGHGDSPTGPEHTLAACASDLAALSRSLTRPPEAIIGHSFGGKVALQYAQDHGHALKQIWVLDCPPDGGFKPSREDSEVVEVVQFLRSLALPFKQRAQVSEALIQAGFSAALGQWMTTNLKACAGGYTWRFDLPTIVGLIESYYHADFYSFLEQAHPPITFVCAERSDRWTPERLSRIAQAPNTSVAPLKNAGHWLHVDNPSGLLGCLQLEGGS